MQTQKNAASTVTQAAVAIRLEAPESTMSIVSTKASHSSYSASHCAQTTSKVSSPLDHVPQGGALSQIFHVPSS